MAILLVISGCGGGAPRDERDAMGVDTVDAGPAAAAPGGMTAEEAVATVKALADRGALKATASVPYEAFVHSRESCSESAAETDSTCKPDLTRTSWFRDKTTPEEKCCRDKRVPIPASAVWSAAYSDDDARWHVRAEFTVAGGVHHATWSVDQQTGNFDELPLTG